MGGFGALTELYAISTDNYSFLPFVFRISPFHLMLIVVWVGFQVAYCNAGVRAPLMRVIEIAFPVPVQKLHAFLSRT